MTRALSVFTMMVAAAALLTATPARAGFEWKGPVAPPAAKMPPAAPSANGNMSGLEPVTMWDSSTSQMPIEKVTTVETTTIAAPVDSMPAPQGGDILSGFGSDLPVAIAVQQVVPAGYQFSFGDGVDPGTLVSWNGGKNWQGVLKDMLQGAGLDYQMQGASAVKIVKSGAAAPMQMQPMQMSVMNEAQPLPPPPSIAAIDNTPVNLMPNTTGIEQMPATGPQPSATPEPKNGAPITIRREKKLSAQKPMRADAPVASMQQTAVTTTTDVPPPPAVANDAPVALVSAPPVESAPMNVTPVDVAPVNVAPVAAVPPAMPQVQAMPQAAWQGAQGQTLREVLKGWSDTAGVDLYWSIDYDYRLSSDVQQSGNYDEAVGKLLEKYSSVRPQPYGELHQGQDGRRVLVIKSYDLKS